MKLTLDHIITTIKLIPRFLRPLLGLKRLDRQRNPDIRNRLKVNNRVEDMKLYQKKWLEHLEGMDGSWLSSTNLGDGGIWEDQDEDGETKNTLSFKGTGLKTKTLITFMMMITSIPLSPLIHNLLPG
jgi:hypothetical protein